MNTPGRNHPCPCGSGKKYKSCHGAGSPDPASLSYHQIRSLDGNATRFFRSYEKDLFRPRSRSAAWKQFRLDDDARFDKHHPETDLFDRWLLFDYVPEHEHLPVTHVLLEEPPDDFPNDLQTFLEATIAAPFSFYQVTAVDPGRHVTARDILRRTDVTVTEFAASKTLRVSDIFYARLVSLEGITFQMGMGARVFPASMTSFFISLRQDMLSRVRRSSLSPDVLLFGEEQLRSTYFGAAEALEEHRRNHKLKERELTTLRKELRQRLGPESQLTLGFDPDQVPPHLAEHALKAAGEKYWSTWPGTPVPLLFGMTPRQASRDPLGRELLESLLLLYERDGRAGFPADTAQLRKMLGLKKR